MKTLWEIFNGEELVMPDHEAFIRENQSLLEENLALKGQLKLLEHELIQYKKLVQRIAHQVQSRESFSKLAGCDVNADVD